MMLDKCHDNRMINLPEKFAKNMQRRSDRFNVTFTYSIKSEELYILSCGKGLGLKQVIFVIRTKINLAFVKWRLKTHPTIMRIPHNHELGHT